MLHKEVALMELYLNGSYTMFASYWIDICRLDFRSEKDRNAPIVKMMQDISDSYRSFTKT